MSEPDILLVLPEPTCQRLHAEARRAGYDVALITPDALGLERVLSSGASLAVVSAGLLSAAWVGRCDRAGVRLIGIAADAAERTAAVQAGVFELADANASWPEVIGLIDGAAPVAPATGGTIAPGLAPNGPALPASTSAAAVALLGAAPHTGPGAPVWHPPTAAAGGRVIAVWGAPGSPGRTTVAVNLAVEASRLGVDTLLIDADVHAAAIAATLGLLDEAPGLAAACRLAGLGELDAIELDRLSRRAGRGGPRVLTGIANPTRWPELAEAKVTSVLDIARGMAGCTIVDVAAPLDQDEHLISDRRAPRRNAATLATLRAADVVVAVVAADPLGISRFLRHYPELLDAVGRARILVVVNKVRPGPFGAAPKQQVSAALQRFASVDAAGFLPWDLAAVDAAALTGGSLVEATSGSGLRAAIAELAAALTDVPTAPAKPRRGAKSKPTRWGSQSGAAAALS